MESSSSIPSGAEKTTTLSLEGCLEADSDILGRTVDCLSSCLSLRSTIAASADVDDNGTVSWARICLLLRAYTWLLIRVPMNRLAGTPSGSDKLAICVDVMQRLVARLRARVLDDAQQKLPSSSGRAFRLLASAAVSAVACLVAVNNEELLKRVEANALLLLQDLFAFPGTSKTMNVFIGKIAVAMDTSDPESLCSIVETTIGDSMTTTASVRDDRFISRLSKLCDWATTRNVGDSTDRFNCAAALVDPSLAVQLLQSDRVSDAVKETTAKDLLTEILGKDENSLVFLRSPEAASFVEIATAVLVQDKGSKLPFVLPMQIERQASALNLLEMTSSLTQAESLFMVQLLYCFIFFELEPTSPFRFDPRVLPLKHVYALCDSSNLNARLSSRLKDCMDRHCPEVKRAQRLLLLTRSNRRPGNVVSPVQSKTDFVALLRKSIAEPHMDPCGIVAEKAFAMARTFLSDADLFASATSALLSRPHSPPLFFSYPILYRDPLVLLKCPISVWSRRGTRRIALQVLMSLLDANEYVVSQSTPCSETQEEFLSSRNELVVRSLLSLATSSSVTLDGSVCQCGLTCGIIRKLVARQLGLSALLIKQNLAETELDWLIESVPETIEDVTALGGVLADRTSLTTAERLVAADGILRLAIAHGQTHPSEAEALVYAALSQLIASFFLIIGPVGVPVNALVGEGNLDATQVSRKATFRMLTALQKVRGYRVRLRNECVMSLQKFAGMCKGEVIVSNMQSAAATRQKNLLKELLDMVMKALDAMGSSAQ